eukprot:TRINITY_DN23873_c0_g1_i1.p1 TRINITY_DN23873_c0_g1~~TRINITY_DN23873_c0_g1_i1.p1  ORF type:complete len:290 (+),score=26.59 TRINITY_DN23873_c0_g1_i1:67-936(+)
MGTGDVIETEITFPGANGAMIRSVFTEPRNPKTAPADCMVMVHGGMSHKNSVYQPAFAKFSATELNMCSLRYDWHGCGESPGDRNMMSGFWDNVADLRSCLRWVRTARNLRVACLIGHSVGGQMALQVCAKYPAEAPRRVVVASSRFFLRYWEEEYHRQVKMNGSWILKFRRNGKKVQHTVSREDAATIGAVDMAEACRAVAGSTDVLVVHGFLDSSQTGGTEKVGYSARVQTCDGVVPLADVAAFPNALPGSTLALLPSVGHNYKEEGAKEKFCQAVGKWLSGPGAKL